MRNKKVIYLLVLYYIFVIFALNSADKTRGLKLIIEEEKGEFKSVTLYNKTHAVLIAIDDYPFENNVSDLNYPINDAEGLKEVLENDYKFDTIVTLYNKEATKRNIEDTLFSLNSRFDYNDALLIFFAGHGYTGTIKGEKIGYLIPYDGSFDDSKMHNNLNMISLRDYISKVLKPKHIFFIFDSCYSGTLFEKKRGRSEKVMRSLEYLKKITEEPVIMGFTAGSDNEEVIDGGLFGHSIFTGRIIEKLKETNDYITAKELITSVSEKVYTDAKNRKHEQTPQGGVLYGQGDFVFIPNYVSKLDNSITVVEKARKELEEYEKMINKAKIEKNKIKEKELEDLAKAIKEDIKSKDLERKRLEEDAKNRKINEEESRVNYSAAEEELALLRLQIKQKEKEVSSIGKNIWNMIDEARKLERRIKESNVDFEKRKTDFLDKTNKYYDELIKELKKIPKGEFEKEIDYERRINDEIYQIVERRKRDISEYDKEINEAKSNIINNMGKTLKNIVKKTYPYPDNKYKIKVGEYNSEEEHFEVTISVLEEILIKGKKYEKWRHFNEIWNIAIDAAKRIGNYREYLKIELKSGITKLNNDYYNDPSYLTIIDPKTNEKLLIQSICLNDIVIKIEERKEEEEERMIEKRQKEIEKHQREEAIRKEKREEEREYTAETEKRERDARRRARISDIKSNMEDIRNNVNYYAVGKGLYIFAAIFPVTNLLFFPYYTKYFDKWGLFAASSITVTFGIIFLCVVPVSSGAGVPVNGSLGGICMGATYIINLIAGIYRAVKYGGWGRFYRDRFGYLNSGNKRKLCFDFGFNVQQELCFEFVVKL